MRRANRSLAALAALALVATAQGRPSNIDGILHISLGKAPAISGSVLSIDTGQAPALSFWAAGPGAIEGADFLAPSVRARVTTGIVGAAQGAIGFAQTTVVPPPPPARPLIAVATYDDGIALHDPRTFQLIGYLGIGGPPGDVAFGASGEIFAPDTDGSTVIAARRAPWSVSRIAGVPEGNEIAFDDASGAVFVTDRDVGSMGALTRIGKDGRVRTVITGVTAEGLAIDARRGRVYVGNVNDETVAQVDARTMAVERKIHSVSRTFGIALDARAQRLYVVANVSPSMHAGGGVVEAIDLAKKHASAVARSAPLTFPLGVALDRSRQRLFVTDEATNVVYVLNARTLARERKPLRTCRTPWRPSIHAGRLYVPCAGSNSVDVFKVSTLHRLPGAPFPTGGFPLSVAQWP